MTATLTPFPTNLVKPSTLHIVKSDNVVSLFPVIDAFNVLVNEFNKVDIEIINVCDELENIILPDDYVIQCAGHRYHIIKIKVTDNGVTTRIMMTTEDAEYLAGVIEWYQSFDMMDDQFQV